MAEKRSITNMIETREGETVSRTKREGANALQWIVFDRIGKAMPEEQADELLLPGANAYNAGEYEAALEQFSQCLAAFPAMKQEIVTQVHFCERVIGTTPDEEDLAYQPPSQGRLGRLLSRNKVEKLRCKWCGHLTPYIDPMDGVAYYGPGGIASNNCERCGGSYPMPDFMWDSPDGLAYSYYRGSMAEESFYNWFEEMLDVKPRTRRHG